MGVSRLLREKHLQGSLTRLGSSSLRSLLEQVIRRFLRLFGIAIRCDPLNQSDISLVRTRRLHGVVHRRCRIRQILQRSH